MLACRLLPAVRAAGPWQMAADEVLLESAARGLASLRFYTWSAPTLSLGYFQPAAVRQADPLLADLPWVRRASGGAALVHHHEMTYALGLPAAWLQRGRSWLCVMHGVIASALRDLGIDLRSCCEESKRGAVLCFLHHTPADLLLGSEPSKVVGSAQRKQRGGLLQHGGILLAHSPHTPALPGIAELSGQRLEPAVVAAAVAAAFAREVGYRLEPADWTDTERRRIEELAAERYGRPAWNEKR